MRVQVLVELDITLCDDDLGDPVAGDPLESRMRASAVEAVHHALRHFEGDGFVHDLDTLTSIQVLSVAESQT